VNRRKSGPPEVFQIGSSTWEKKAVLDGGQNEIGFVSWRAGLRRVQIGPVAVPPKLIVEIPGGDGGAGVRMTIEVVRGIPRCTTLRFSTTNGGAEITTTAVRSFRIEDWIERATAAAGLEVRHHKSYRLIALEEHDQTEPKGRQAIRVARRNKTSTHEFLEEIADVYRANLHQSGTLAYVAAHFGKSVSSAGQYVCKARAAGYLPPTKPGKKGG
jgi:hypothetical protein